MSSFPCDVEESQDQSRLWLRRGMPVALVGRERKMNINKLGASCASRAVTWPLDFADLGCSFNESRSTSF